MHTIAVGRMGEMPVGWRQQFRKLSLGPRIEWGAWSWSFQDGSCWVAFAFVGTQPVAWAAITKEVDYLPVAAVYVHPAHRGQGLARLCATALVQSLLGTELSPGDKVYCASERWSKWGELMEASGLVCVEWDWKPGD